ncbi:AraC family transcriptional regulator [Pleurocapsa sp. FMAR1]|uniref:AraC family transcriptional regulator n=1 Tax=Pleurocapsa sp. FMAR1 TaxID=3040204 RepID=UPI0029C6F825|nr:AraC family transcriptional regulator [Pleurocapsa sp. FMAR1]
MRNREANESLPPTIVYPHDINRRIVAQKIAHQGSFVVSHHFELDNQKEVAATNHHWLCYLLRDCNLQQITRIGDREYTGETKRGDIWLKPNSHHGFWSSSDSDECLSLIFKIAPDFLRQIALENDFANADSVEILPVLNKHDSQLQNLAMLFQQEIAHTQSGNQMYIESLSNMLAVHLLRHYCTFPVKVAEYTGGLPPYKLKQVTDYINTYLADDISLGELASHVKLSQSHFSHLFRQSTGKSPYKFLIQQRIDRAQELLLKQDMAIADVASSVGFYDQSHLSRHMKKLLGVSPRQLRQQR